MGSPGSQWTVHELVERYYASLYRYAYRLTGSASDAEDLTQEAFCKAQLKQEQLRDPTRAKAWLFSILRNAYLHRIRTSRQQKLVSLDDLPEMPEVMPDPLPAIEPEQLQEALSELPEVFRTPVIMYYFEEFSYRDIAEQMELPLGTVMSRLARAKSYLRARLVAPADEPLVPSQRRANHGL